MRDDIPTEQTLDDKLWLDPHDALDDFKYLVRANRGEMTPLVNRLTLKALAWPIFIREFEGDAVTPETKEDLQHIADLSAEALDRYLDLLDDPDTDQNILNQGINDLVAFNLAARALCSKGQVRISLLPVSPAVYHINTPTTFTVLRPEKKGRAQLVISDTPQATPLHTPHTAEQYRIQIRPNELVEPGVTVHDLAESLVEELYDEPPTDRALRIVSYASNQLHAKIYDHFDQMQ